ncbi:hypothetical protein [Flavobacterium sp.]|uniref:hypothetical protein n=1 Tax=Flavobacterium sp. TaxID=239 RepID=UPI00374DE4CA
MNTKKKKTREIQCRRKQKKKTYGGTKEKTKKTKKQKNNKIKNTDKSNKQEKIEESFKPLSGDMNGGGIFCYMPFDVLDKQQKQKFKVEFSSDINDQLKKLKTIFPVGFSMIACVTNPKEGKIKNGLYIDYYNEIIQFIFLLIQKNGGTSPVFSNKRDNGWIYCTIDNIHDAFRIAQIQYGGIFTPFFLEGTSIDDHETIIIENDNKKPQFIGKLVYHT